MRDLDNQCDGEVISYIRDEMLANPAVSADFVYKVTKLAERNVEMMELLNAWMKETSETNRIVLEFHMGEVMDEFLILQSVSH